MSFILDHIVHSAAQVMFSLWHNWPYLMASMLVAAALKLFMDTDRVAILLRRYRGAGILAATTVAVSTPLCSCGTTAVVLGMMANLMPWAPIIAFMVASPLTSPGELIYSAGLFGWPFAMIFFAASIVLGLAGGLVGLWFDSRGWLAGQTRMVTRSHCVCKEPTIIRSRISANDYFTAICSSGKQLLKMFLIFAFVGYFLNGLIPSEWVSAAFGRGNRYSIPLAATVGLPFYMSTEASLPLIRALLDSGMSHGAAMAFMISGAGTSIGAIAGALTIARWRIIALVVAVLWVGAIAFGYFSEVLFANI